MPPPRDQAHPYVPNSAPAVRAQMLQTVGVATVDELYSAIPDDLRLKAALDLAPPFPAELDLKRHVGDILKRSVSTDEFVSFLGGGAWKHWVPAVVDEVVARQEFLTAYGGGPYSDHGKYQAIFEFQSMLGELLEMDVVSAPTYDWVTAATSAILMATRITGRSEVLIAGTVNPELIEHLRTFATPWLTFQRLAWSPTGGCVDLDQLADRLSTTTAAVYFENPSYLGFVETQAPAIVEAVHRVGGLCVVGVDPSSLGVLAPPGQYGADIACGDAQPLGVHMYYGGGVCGFIASRDDPTYVSEYPTFIVGAVPGKSEGELGFGWSTMDRTSFDQRGLSRDFTGSSQWLWGIAAAVYMALLGPQGMMDLGRSIAMNARYAMRKLSSVPGVSLPMEAAPHFKEFVVSFDPVGPSVAEINSQLLSRGMFGGAGLSRGFPELGNSALYCVTELHRREDIDRLAAALAAILQ